jgi:hypothetical protein
VLRNAGFRRWSPVSKRHRALHVSPNHPGFCDEGSLIRKQRVVKLKVDPDAARLTRRRHAAPATGDLSKKITVDVRGAPATHAHHAQRFTGKSTSTDVPTLGPSLTADGRYLVGYSAEGGSGPSRYSRSERIRRGRRYSTSDRIVFHERPVRPSGQVTPTPHALGSAASKPPPPPSRA